MVVAQPAATLQNLLTAPEQVDQQAALMNWNSSALIAPDLCGSSIFLNHTITKALFTHTHVHTINIWAQETTHQVAMPTQHTQQLNSTPASVFKDPLSHL